MTMAEIIKLDGTGQLDFDREMVEQAYDRWAPVYDLVFGGVFSKGRKAAIQATNKIGGRVLGGRRRHRHLVAAIRAAPSHLRHRYFGSDAAKGQEARRPSSA